MSRRHRRSSRASLSSIQFLLVVGLGVISAGTVRGQVATAARIDPGTRVDVDYQYYEVSGSTDRQILASMLETGPAQNGDRYFALTSAQTGFSFQTKMTSDGCVLEDVGVRVHVVMTIPKWNAPADAPIELRRSWLDFVADLLKHEQWHATAARNSAEAMFDALSSLRQPTCTGLDSHAKVSVQKISDRLVRQNGAYDRDTRHGRTQGAAWPPLAVGSR